jgi:inorganic pyrophosphatase
VNLAIALLLFRPQTALSPGDSATTSCRVAADSMSNTMNALAPLPPFDAESGDLNVVIETPRGSRNKFGWDEGRELFKLNGLLPVGAVFPYDFGFIPNTRGEDGDALDVLLLMDESAFPGCLVAARLLGVIEAEQTEEERTERNDRLIAVASTSRTHGHLQALDDLNPRMVDEIEHFFVSYNAAKGKKFKPVRRSGPSRAEELVRAGEKAKADA